MWSMKIRSLLLLMTLCAVFVWAQAAATGDRNTAVDAQTIRIIRDPHNGIRWLLERAAGNPGGPARLILLDDPEATSSDSSKILGASTQAARPNVIHAGDRLVIEERSALVEARLEAVSLGTAVPGAEFNARLAIGGKVVRAVALEPGLAAFAAAWGARQ
jgi:hypothetical protein